MINYPNGKSGSLTHAVNLSGNSLTYQELHDTRGRGISLETELNDANAYYLEMDRAVIHKKPTPVQIVHVDYPSRKKAKITEAYFKIPSTTDYNGIYRGKYIDFEAKEVAKTFMPFQNIHPHQIEHLRKVLKHGGIAFVVISFTKQEEVYLFKAETMIDRYDHPTRKSISYEDCKENGYLIKRKLSPRLDYLEVVDQVFFKEEE